MDVMDHLTVKDAVADDRRVDVIPENMPFEEILQLMLSSSQQDFPVVNREGILSGIISMTDLRQAMADVKLHSLLVAKDVAMEGVITVTTCDSLNTALKLMASLDVRELPVVSEDGTGKVMSMISRKDITQRYHREMEEMQKGRVKTDA